MPATGVACRRKWHLALGSRALCLGLALLTLGCASWFRSGVHVVIADPPSDVERYCAWYGDASGNDLYVGLAPFWSAMRSAGDDPLADLAEPGPQWVGRFDLTFEGWRRPLDVGHEGARSGVWDVHHTDEGVYFTTYYEGAGRVEPDSGRVTRFEEAGAGLNEIAAGPDGHVLMSRYGSGDGSKSGGELLTLDEEGAVMRRWPLPAPLGFFAAPKTPAWNPARERLLSTTDVLPEFDGPNRHDAYVGDLSEQPIVWETLDEPEIQFVAVAENGSEYRVEAHQSGALWLRRIRPPGHEPEDQRVKLDDAFLVDLDFVQDLKFAVDGRIVITRWSGAIHVVSPNGRVARVQLPHLERGGLYYTAVIHGSRLCATYCGEVTVVCTDAPSAEPSRADPDAP